MQIAFLDSWLQSSAEGSGTAVAIGGLQAALADKGVRVARLAPAAGGPRGLLARRLRFNLELPGRLRALGADLVVGFDIDGFWWGRRLRGRTPYVASVKGVLAEEARQERGRVRAYLWGLSRLERLNVRHADGVLTTSAYCRRAIAGHYGVAEGRIGLVPEGIDLGRWRRAANVAPGERDGATILCVARQYPRKHVADLIYAMAEVRRAVPRARAVIIGDGPEHAALRLLAARLDLGASVQLLGAIPDDDEVLRAYRRADIFCLPSVQEGFGIVFLEAMASGLPVVSTTAAAIPETVPEGEAGLLVPPGDRGALAGALIELLESPRRRRMMGAAGLAHVAGYDWPAVAERFLGVAAEMAGAGQEGPQGRPSWPGA